MPFDFAFTSDWPFRMRARVFANLNSSILFAVRRRSSSNNAINSDFFVDELGVLDADADADAPAESDSDSLDFSDFLSFFAGGAIFDCELNLKIGNNRMDTATFE